MTDKYDIGNRLFAHSCPCGAPLTDKVFCQDCRVRFEALIARLTRHVHATYAETTIYDCTSCGDASLTPLCTACAECGERLAA